MRLSKDCMTDCLRVLSIRMSAGGNGGGGVCVCRGEGGGGGGIILGRGPPVWGNQKPPPAKGGQSRKPREKTPPAQVGV